jgi:hypothetical protein
MSFPEADLALALRVLELHTLPPSRRALALRVNRRHPARTVWTKQHTAAYRLLWEVLHTEFDEQNGRDEAAAA